MVLAMPAISRNKAADSPKKMTMMACRKKEKRRRVRRKVRGGAQRVGCSRGQSDRHRDNRLARAVDGLTKVFLVARRAPVS